MAATILALSFIASTVAAEVKQALIVDVPDTWKVEFKGDQGIQFYSVTRKEGDTALLMFSRSPVYGNVSQIPEQIQVLANGFIAEAKGQEGLKLKRTDFKIGEIKGAAFSGKFVEFEVEGGFSQIMFMIGDNEGIWNGQFTGTKERWAEALQILKKLKPKR